MSNENSNVVSFLDNQRRRIRQRHANVLDLARTMIEEAECDCEFLFGASADEIAHLSAILVEHIYDIGDPANAQYFHVLLDMRQEELAGFAAAVAGDVLAECRADDPAFDRHKLWGQRLVNARRLVSES